MRFKKLTWIRFFSLLVWRQNNKKKLLKHIIFHRFVLHIQYQIESNHSSENKNYLDVISTVSGWIESLSVLDRNRFATIKILIERRSRRWKILFNIIMFSSAAQIKHTFFLYQTSLTVHKTLYCCSDQATKACASCVILKLKPCYCWFSRSKFKWLYRQKKNFFKRNEMVYQI